MRPYVAYPLLVLAALIILTVTGCKVGAQEEHPTLEAAGQVYYVTDSATGCQYISFRDGLAPRLWPDGKPICRRVK